MSNSDNKDVSVTCAGEDLFAIAGGAMLSGATEENVAIVETRPSALPGQIPGGWMASAVEINPTTGDWALTVYAVCAKVN